VASIRFNFFFNFHPASLTEFPPHYSPVKKLYIQETYFPIVFGFSNK